MTSKEFNKEFKVIEDSYGRSYVDLEGWTNHIVKNLYKLSFGAIVYIARERNHNLVYGWSIEVLDEADRLIEETENTVEKVLLG